jgi:hypothetical protein
MSFFRLERNWDRDRARNRGFYRFGRRFRLGICGFEGYFRGSVSMHWLLINFQLHQLLNEHFGNRKRLLGNAKKGL